MILVFGVPLALVGFGLMILAGILLGICWNLHEKNLILRDQTRHKGMTNEERDLFRKRNRATDVLIPIMVGGLLVGIILTARGLWDIATAPY
ncbi:hypothetical protein [Shimazuella kribbensis]|uniref:hypothetical protein n=1 Tax=Shimazuella kribbensis TaxID=139808 RepID=UPI0012EC4AEC|nr:hypothetical protein [Shimazuella kribbensis]